MNLIDRILKGDFNDKENVDVPATKTHNQQDLEATCSSELPFNPDEEEEEVATDEDGDEDFDEYFSSEDVNDENTDDTPETDLDIPSDEWVEEHIKENKFDTSKSEPVLTASTQYVEKPKQSKVRKIKKTMDNKTNETSAQTAPKQSTTKSADEGTKKRGAPHKLTENADEACRLYTEGVSARTIAEKFLVSVSCVISTLKRNNVPIRQKGRRKTSD